MASNISNSIPDYVRAEYVSSDENEMVDDDHYTSSTDDSVEETDPIKIKIELRELFDKIVQKFPEAAKEMLQPMDTSWTVPNSSNSGAWQPISSSTPMTSATQVSPTKLQPRQHFKELGNLDHAPFSYVARKKQYYKTARDINVRDACDQINMSHGQSQEVQAKRLEKAKQYFHHAVDADNSCRAAIDALKDKSE